MEEIWKYIPEWEGFYQASNLGRIRSVDRVVMKLNSRGFLSPRIYKGKLLSPNVNNSGYQYLCMCKDKDHRWFAKVHRVIAMTFLHNPNHLSDVNHKDGNKLNNKVENLEWCSHSDNQKHALRIGLNIKPYAASRYKKAVTQIDPKTKKIVAEYASIHEATSHLGKTNPSNISGALNGRHRIAYGFEWKYK